MVLAFKVVFVVVVFAGFVVFVVVVFNGFVVFVVVVVVAGFDILIYFNNYKK